MAPSPAASCVSAKAVIWCARSNRLHSRATLTEIKLLRFRMNTLFTSHCASQENHHVQAHPPSRGREPDGIRCCADKERGIRDAADARARIDVAAPGAGAGLATATASASACTTATAARPGRRSARNRGAESIRGTGSGARATGPISPGSCWPAAPVKSWTEPVARPPISRPDK